MEELLKGVIMVSANDGCVALAEHLSKCGKLRGADEPEGGGNGLRTVISSILTVFLWQPLFLRI
ncbi:MAG: hypothetical protein ACLRQA_00040 [Anaerovoracaceae bacterium]